ncbi:hypothetical protein G9A89_016039 [Geosiphon pyriformis]|nr:hypothetical protein G9A89_016039 [Geosiphon pyriformis]
MESQAGLTLFLAAGAFAATQHIFNVASDFFCLNDISINNNKTVVIPINCQITVPYLTISGMPIFIAKRAHSDDWFFINLILRKAISDKQFTYLVSSVLFPIVSYRTQFNALIRKGLKSKSGLPLNFSNDVFHHPFLYNLKTFEQIQAESKLASVIAFANLVLSWRFHPSLLFFVYVRVSPSNNFLAGVVHIFSRCDLSLGGSLASAFHLRSGTPMFLVLSKTIFFKCVSSLRHYDIAFTFKHWKRLDPHGPVLSWFDLSVCFLGGVASLSSHSPYEGVCGSSDICQSFGFGVICNDLLNVSATRLSVYTDGSLSNLGTVDMLADTAVFFENIDLGLGVGVSGLVFSTLVELQAIVLALKCVPSFCLVDLFSDSQTALDVCRSESLSVGSDFRNYC